MKNRFVFATMVTALSGCIGGVEGDLGKLRFTTSLGWQDRLDDGRYAIGVGLDVTAATDSSEQCDIELPEGTTAISTEPAVLTVSGSALGNGVHGCSRTSIHFRLDAVGAGESTLQVRTIDDRLVDQVTATVAQLDHLQIQDVVFCAPELGWCPVVADGLTHLSILRGGFGYLFVRLSTADQGWLKGYLPLGIANTNPAVAQPVANIDENPDDEANRGFIIEARSQGTTALTFTEPNGGVSQTIDIAVVTAAAVVDVWWAIANTAYSESDPTKPKNGWLIARGKDANGDPIAGGTCGFENFASDVIKLTAADSVPCLAAFEALAPGTARVRITETVSGVAGAASFDVAP